MSELSLNEGEGVCEAIRAEVFRATGEGACVE